MVFAYHIFFIYLSVDGYWCCFYNLASIDSAAMNMQVHWTCKHLFESLIFFFCINTKKQIAGLHGSSLVNPKGNQSLIFIGSSDAEAEAPILWTPDAKYWLIGKDPDSRKDGRQEEKGTMKDEIIE